MPLPGQNPSWIGLTRPSICRSDRGLLTGWVVVRVGSLVGQRQIRNRVQGVIVLRDNGFYPVYGILELSSIIP